MKKIIGNPNQKNEDLINLINKTKINHYYIKNYKDFRDRIVKDISSEDVVLDCGKAMREKFQDINCKSIETIDVNNQGDHFSIIVVSDRFNNMSLINRHKLIYEIFAQEITKEIHALHIKTYTHSEWKKNNIQ